MVVPAGGSRYPVPLQLGLVAWLSGYSLVYPATLLRTARSRSGPRSPRNELLSMIPVLLYRLPATF